MTNLTPSDWNDWRTLHNRHTGETLRIRRPIQDGQPYLELHGTLGPRQEGPPLHVHHAEAEEGVIHSGQLSATVDGRSMTVRAGETAVLPAGSAHRWWNAGDDELRFSGVVRPLVDLDVFLPAIFDVVNRSPVDRPSLFYLAHLAWRHRSTQTVLFAPRWLQRVLLPVIVLVGTVLGRYRGTGWPGCPEPVSSMRSTDSLTTRAVDDDVSHASFTAWSRWATWCGIVAPPAFALLVILAGRSYPGYEHGAQAISELAAADSPSPALQTLNFYVTGLLTVAFATSLARGRGRALGAALFGALGAMMIVHGALPCDAGCEFVTPTGTAHNVVGLVGFVCAIVGVWLVGRQSSDRLFRTWSRVAALAGGAGLVGWIGVAKVAQVAWLNGTLQRAFVAVILVWMFVTAARQLRSGGVVDAH